MNYLTNHIAFAPNKRNRILKAAGVVAAAAVTPDPILHKTPDNNDQLAER